MTAPMSRAPGDERLRFKGFDFQRLASGRCRATVVLASPDGREFTGESEGIISQAGELRCGAAATVRALERVVQPKLAFELLGVKAVRAARSPGVAARGGLPDRDRRATGRGSCGLERDEPHSRQFFRDAMKGE